MSKSRKRSHRRKKEARKVIMNLLLFLWVNIRVLLDSIIDSIFGWFYNGKEVRIPTTSKHYLSESATSVAASIRDKIRTSEEVVKAYIERSKEVNGIINAVTDDRFDQALEEAKQIDKDIASGKINEETFKNKPFLGVPFTSKESTSCLGLRCTFGMISRQAMRAEDDADVIKLIKNAGGILIANTNIPEFNLWQECNNNVYGRTLNPYNTTRTTGGSSGGEAALIASCGTAFGIGTDIGGSIRMPAFFCGIFGHKPTSYLISTKGLTKRTGQEKHTMVVPGPMCRHAADITPLLKVLVGKNVGKLRLDAAVDIRKLRYFFVEDSLDRRSSSVCLEMRQLMKTVVNHFIDELPDETQEKVVCLDDVEELEYSYRLWRYWMTQEPLKFPLEIGNGEPLNVWMEIIKKITGQSNFTLAALIKLIDDVVLPKENETWAVELTTKLRTKLLTLLDKNGVLLYPSYTWPASYHYTAYLRPFNFSYWCIFNVLQFPVTQVPMGLSKDGLPMGIQVVAAPYNDHLCIAVAKHLETVFGGYKPPFQ